MTVTQPDDYGDIECEIINGEKIPKKEGARHGRIGVKVLTELAVYLERNPIGELFASTTTYELDGNELMPDISFMAASRIPPGGVPIENWKIAPDLAVEVISPIDLWNRITLKVSLYFAAGVKQVWLISEALGYVQVYDSPTLFKVVNADEDFTSEALLPGFKCRVAELFQS